ncbi:hypothetical protein DAPPUDRAFT_236949 [Daphnia pulex]|uniref:Uncharacterized protein n=1 Tax=Daphnia pulex TaxID=6669 RepID=E9G2C6_DAPPU|nr:hypothetical protein DAPPUDRAFT_236949 [Daphnia pulex]|eukprot:EFX86226.1 hypothetical protein DAPPUDRAFT_236949 [Daphnia pulex]
MPDSDIDYPQKLSGSNTCTTINQRAAGRRVLFFSALSTATYDSTPTGAFHCCCDGERSAAAAAQYYRLYMFESQKAESILRGLGLLSQRGPGPRSLILTNPRYVKRFDGHRPKSFESAAEKEVKKVEEKKIAFCGSIDRYTLVRL